ncbi:hypothetical protein ACOSQ2_025113 [Xanthoceras sorbifolium]
MGQTYQQEAWAIHGPCRMTPMVSCGSSNLGVDQYCRASSRAPTLYEPTPFLNGRMTPMSMVELLGPWSEPPKVPSCHSTYREMTHRPYDDSTHGPSMKL